MVFDGSRDYGLHAWGALFSTLLVPAALLLWQRRRRRFVRIAESLAFPRESP